MNSPYPDSLSSLLKPILPLAIAAIAAFIFALLKKRKRRPAARDAEKPEKRIRAEKVVLAAFCFSIGFGLIAMMFLLDDDVAPLVFCSFMAGMTLIPINAYCPGKSRVVRLLLSLFPAASAWFFLPLAWADSVPGSFERILHNSCLLPYFLSLIGFIFVQAVGLFLQPEIESFKAKKAKIPLWGRVFLGTLFLCTTFVAYFSVVLFVEKAFLSSCRIKDLSLAALLPAGIVMNIILGIINGVTWNKARECRIGFSAQK